MGIFVNDILQQVIHWYAIGTMWVEFDKHILLQQVIHWYAIGTEVKQEEKVE